MLHTNEGKKRVCKKILTYCIFSFLNIFQENLQRHGLSYKKTAFKVWKYHNYYGRNIAFNGRNLIPKSASLIEACLDKVI